MLIAYILLSVSFPSWGVSEADFESIARPLMELSVVLIANLLFFVCLLVFTTYSATRTNKALRTVQLTVNTDPLTNILNRRGLNTNLKSYQHSQGFYFVIDIDDFKPINDLYGHDTGDEVIQYIAATLQQGVRDEDLVSRFGGEEFIVFLPSVQKERALIVAERLVKAVAAKDFVSSKGISIQVTISLGGVEKTKQEQDFNSTFSSADKQLYLAKESGKNKAIILCATA